VELTSPSAAASTANPRAAPNPAAVPSKLTAPSVPRGTLFKDVLKTVVLPYACSQEQLVQVLAQRTSIIPTYKYGSTHTLFAVRSAVMNSSSDCNDRFRCKFSHIYILRASRTGERQRGRVYLANFAGDGVTELADKACSKTRLHIGKPR